MLKKYYALRESARSGRFEIVKYLIDKGADIHADDDFALRESATRGNFEIVKYLVDKGTDIHAYNK